MSAAATTPVLAGVGQFLQRLDDPREGLEPLEMMVAALERAGEDCGAPALLECAESIYVLRGAWRYGEPGRIVAGRLGAAPRETVGTPYGGNFAQACVIDAAREIAAGRIRVALVTGVENGRSQSQAQRQGVRLTSTDAPGEPDRMLGDFKAIFHDAELARGFDSASDVYALIDSAIRFERGESLAAHGARIARLWARCNEVARDNPNAWIQKPYTAQEIGTAGPDNPMISFPYPRLMNANARVDMGAGIVVCSLEAAREAGVPEDRLVFLHAATEANDNDYLSERPDLHRSPAMRIAGGRVLELAGKGADEIDHVDLYSCFPSAVQIAAREIGLSQDRSLTVTGGLTFGGGPLNSYTLHAIARMAEVLRDDRGATGLVSGNGGWLAKHAFAVYSSERPAGGFRYENLQDRVDGVPLRRALVDWDGPVAVEAYTVAHRAGAPRRAFVSCLTDDGRRTWGTLDDPGVMDAMMREELCGRRGRLDGAGTLRLD